MTRLATRYLMSTLALGASLLTAACGDDDDSDDDDAVVIDSGLVIDATDVDADIDAGSALTCGDVTAPAATISTFPGTASGDLADAVADLDLAVACDVSLAPEQVISVGVEEVVALTGLTPGSTYYARVDSPADLVVYVITGCDGTAASPATGECLAVSDQFYAGVEPTPFIAPASGSAYLVVDHFEEGTPVDGTYTVSVSTDGCREDSECTSLSAPLCEAQTLSCGSIDYCVGDDAAESQTDDIPAGATVLDLSSAPSVVVSANVCADTAQGAEYDYYSFTMVNGGAVKAELAWVDTAVDIDIVIRNQAGDRALGLSYFQNPEVVELSYLAAGTYYIEIQRYEPADSVEVTPYTLSVSALPVALCTSNADCGNVFDKQFFRAQCDTASGACVDLEGAGAVALGDVCDSFDDCAAGATRCANLSFTADPDVRSICTLDCTADADCATVDALAKCTIGAQTNYCTLPCTADNQCEAIKLPAAGQPWGYGTCVVAEGRCNLTPPA